MVTRDDETLADVPLIKVDQVVIFGMVQVTTQALALLMDEGKDVVFLTYAGRYRGRVVGPHTQFGKLRRYQYLRVADANYTLETARRIVVGKLSNQRVLIMRYGRTFPSSELAGAAEELGRLIEQTDHCYGLRSLQGCEGRGAAVYYQSLRGLLKQDLGFRARRRRPPPDPVNALLSFGYTLLAGDIESAVSTVGLDPYLGFLHGDKYGRPSLVLDLMEEFRPIIVDSVVMKAVNSHILTADDFTYTADPQRPVRLSREGVKRFIHEYEGRVNTRVRYPDTDEQVTYRRCFELQVRQLARCFQAEGQYYRPFQVR